MGSIKSFPSGGASEDKKSSTAVGRKGDDVMEQNVRRKDRSLRLCPCHRALSVRLAGHMTGDQFGYRSVRNPPTYGDINDTVSETQRPIKPGL